ncbi:hypothetical protein [Desulfoferula mesophila]|uniref:Secreted protein n=1 Tax=Desulfoferula mesophila TaxID=3058419 RepID=A0AAU9EG59_9BACT|nr:hypothetical protein FAK_00070 [Desulfoferula mesophilus]
MKKSALLLILVALLLSLTVPAPAGEKCLRVQLDGTIFLRPRVPANAPKVNDDVLSCRTDGKFHVDMIFPRDGGQVISQDNWVVITGFKCSPKKRHAECRHVVDPEAFQHEPFTLSATLTPDGSSRYALEFFLDKLPRPKPIYVTIECPNSPPQRINDYGSKYQQLLLASYLNKIWLNMALDQKQHQHPEKMELPPFDTAELEWDELLTLAPCPK